MFYSVVLFIVRMCGLDVCSSLFFFNDTATTEIYTLSLHDALPILEIQQRGDPREIFCSGQNLNSHRNHLIWWQISCIFHIWKPFCAAVHGFLTVNYLKQVTFELKKHAIQHGQNIFLCWSLSKPMADWSPRPVNSACKVSLSYAALLPRNAASKFWKFSKGGNIGNRLATVNF